MELEKQIQTKPFLKWPGGKQKLISTLCLYLPKDIEKEGKITTYIEPFVGAGSMLFYIREHYPHINCVISDKNEKLMNVYRTVKDDVDDLIHLLYRTQETYNSLNNDEREQMYYEVRKAFNDEERRGLKSKVDCIQQAGRFIFLNKTGFNGLYRENKKGEVNVPFGCYKSQKHTLFNEKNIRQASALLQEVKILHGEYTIVEDYIDEHTFIYMDPPYRPIAQKTYFKEYTKEGQAHSFQNILSEYVKSLHKLGVYVLETNSDPTENNPSDDYFERQYDFCNIHRITAKRSISADKNKRGNVRELIITNYDDSIK